MGQRMVLLDTRLHGDYVMGRNTGATSIFVELEDFLDQLPPDTWIINYAAAHAISGRAFDAQREAGFTKIAVLDEGCTCGPTEAIRHPSAKMETRSGA